MKKLKKYMLIHSSLIAAAATVIGVVLFSDIGIFANKSTDKLNDSKNQKQNFVNFDIDTNSKPDLLNKQNRADINIYFTTRGTDVYYDLIRLSMLSKSENYFFVLPNNSLVQSRTDAKLLEDFYNSQRVDVKNKNSKVIKIKKGEDEAVLSQVEHIINSNPYKRINIWTNSNNFERSVDYANLSTYKNVQINGLNQDTSIGFSILYKGFDPKFRSEYFDSTNKVWNLYKGKFLNSYNQYLLSINFNHINYYWSTSEIASRFNENYLKNNFAYFNDDNETLNNLLTKTKSSDNKYLITYFTNIIGNNWQKTRDIIESDIYKNKKKPLLVLGRGSKSDFNDLITVVAKYANDYNIYYKSDPGADAVYKDIDLLLHPGNKISYTQNTYINNVVTTQKQEYTISQNTIIRTIDNFLSYEDLIKYHANQPDGFWFNKYISFKEDDDNLKLINNKRNEFSDFIGYFNVDNVYISSDSNNSKIRNMFQSQLDKLISSIATENYKIDIKTEAINTPIDQLKPSDFIFSSNDNSLFVVPALKDIKIINFDRSKKSITFKYPVTVRIFVWTNSSISKIYENFKDTRVFNQLK
ncbi:hypothetical protein ACXYRQ_04155 [Mycoplasma sp. 394]